MVVLKKHNGILRSDCGYAVVEATILFPIMIMLFFTMVLLATYLPQRTILQEAAQAAAVAIATENSDTYVAFDEDGQRVEKEYPQRVFEKNGQFNKEYFNRSVYGAAIDGMWLTKEEAEAKAASIVEHYAGKGVFAVPGKIDVQCSTTNYVIYQEVCVTVTQTIPVPVNFSFIGIPSELTLVQEAKAVVQNGDEFIRNVDIVKDLGIWAADEFGVSEKLSESKLLDKLGEALHYFGFGA